MCHAAKLGGSLIIGLGNPNVDFASEGSALGVPASMFEALAGSLSDEESVYDFERLGWPFEEVGEKGDDTTVYDTTRPMYGNGGHTFAASLSDEERRDLLEYLKTL